MSDASVSPSTMISPACRVYGRCYVTNELRRQLSRLPNQQIGRGVSGYNREEFATMIRMIFRRPTRAPVTLALAALSLTVASALAQAASPNGTWLRSNGAHVEVFDCGDGLGMKVTKSPDAAKVGKQIMCGAKTTAADRWEGSLLNLEDGQTYKGIVELKGGALSLSGCVLGGIVCKTDTWSRVK